MSSQNEALVDSDNDYAGDYAERQKRIRFMHEISEKLDESAQQTINQPE